MTAPAKQQTAETKADETALEIAELQQQNQQLQQALDGLKIRCFDAEAVRDANHAILDQLARLTDAKNPSELIEWVTNKAAA